MEQHAQSWVASYQQITEAPKSGFLANYPAGSTDAELPPEPVRSRVLELLKECGLRS